MEGQNRLTMFFIGVLCICIGLTLGIKFRLSFLNIGFCLLGGHLVARAFLPY